jgi:hypothetical protein
MRVAKPRLALLLPLSLGIALPGCEDPLHVQPPGAVDRAGGELPALTVAISGPRVVTEKGTYVWEAVPSGASAEDEYRWELSYPGSGARYQLGSARTQTKTVYANDDRFELTVTVASRAGSASGTLVIDECIDGCAFASAAAP